MVAEHFRHSLDSVEDITVDMERVEPDPELELDKLWTRQDKNGEILFKSILFYPFSPLFGIYHFLTSYYKKNNRTVLHPFKF